MSDSSLDVLVGRRACQDTLPTTLGTVRGTNFHITLINGPLQRARHADLLCLRKRRQRSGHIVAARTRAWYYSRNLQTLLWPAYDLIVYALEH
jgi:hypothetical protein